MADEVLNNLEQSERVVRWLRQNAAGLIGGIVLGFVLIAGWQWWQKQRLNSGMQASSEYAAAIKQFADGKLAKGQGLSAVTAIDKSNPTLGTLAALQLAKAQVDAGNTADAIVTLQNLHSVEANLRPVVQVRLARLLIDTGKAKEALALLKDDRNAEMLTVRGDAEFALGQRTQAEATYRKALGLLDVADPQHRLTTLKLIEAGGTPPHTEDAS